MMHPGKVSLFVLFTLISLLVDSCSALTSSNDPAGRDLVIAVWEGPAAQRTQLFAAEYSKLSGNRVSVMTYPEWQYGSLVEARLLAGTSPWDVIYLKGEWVPQLIKDHAIADITPLIGSEQKQRSGVEEFGQGGGLYGLPVDGNLPFVFFRKDQVSGNVVGSYGRIGEYLGFLSQMDLPAGEYPSGIALGSQNVQLELIPYSSFIAHSQLITPANTNEKINVTTLLKSICGPQASPIFAPQSIRWGEADLAAALQNGRIASAVLWADTGASLLSCTKDGPACKNGESLIGFTKIPFQNSLGKEEIPRLMNAWTVPARNARMDAAARWLEWVGSAQGELTWQKLGGTPLSRKTQNQPDSIGSVTEQVKGLFFSAYPVSGTAGFEVLQTKLSEYIHECANGKLSPENFLERYNQEISLFLKQSDQVP